MGKIRQKSPRGRSGAVFGAGSIPYPALNRGLQRSRKPVFGGEMAAAKIQTVKEG